MEYNLNDATNEASSTTQEIINFSFRTKYSSGFLFHSGEWWIQACRLYAVRIIVSEDNIRTIVTYVIERKRLAYDPNTLVN